MAEGYLGNCPVFYSLWLVVRIYMSILLNIEKGVHLIRYFFV